MARSTGIGIDVGTHNLRIAEVKRNGAGFALTNVFCLKIGAGDIDGRQAVQDPQMQELIRNRLSSSSFRKGMLGFSGKEVLYRYIHFPPVPPWKLDMMVDYELKQGDTENDEISYDYRLLTLPKGLANEYTVLAAMAKNDKLGAMVNAMKNAGLKMEQISPSPVALFNTFTAHEERTSGKTVLVADIGAEKTEIAILNDSNLYFVRTLPIGGAAFTQVIQEELDLTPEKAEEMKLEKGRILFEGDADADDPENQQISAALKRAALQISSQIQASIRFGASNIRLKDLKVDAYYLTGGGARLQGLVRYWQSVFNMPVHILNPLRGLDLSAFPQKRIEEIITMPSQYSTAIGLALGAFGGQMTAMNMLPEREKKRIEFLNHRLPLYAAMVIFLLATIIFTVFNAGVSSELDDIRADLIRTDESMQGRIRVLENEITATDDVVEQYEFINGRAAENRSLLQIIDAFQNVRPEEIWLRQAGTRKDPDSGDIIIDMKVSAKESETESANAVFDSFKNRFQAHTAVASIEVAGIEDATDRDRRVKVIAFSVIAQGGK